MILRNADSTWTAVGIVSYDFNPFLQETEETFLHCRNAPSTPRAFTRINSYIDWIHATTAKPSTPADLFRVQPTNCSYGPCGKANGPGADPNSRAIQSMASNEFPWLTYLYFANSDEDQVWCSGSIIASKWILTAASCLDVYRFSTLIY